MAMIVLKTCSSRLLSSFSWTDPGFYQPSLSNLVICSVFCSCLTDLSLCFCCCLPCPINLAGFQTYDLPASLFLLVCCLDFKRTWFLIHFLLNLFSLPLLLWWFMALHPRLCQFSHLNVTIDVSGNVIPSWEPDHQFSIPTRPNNPWFYPQFTPDVSDLYPTQQIHKTFTFAGCRMQNA